MVPALDTVASKVDKLTIEMEFVKHSLNSMGFRFPEVGAITHSPKALTDLGKLVAKELRDEIPDFNELLYKECRTVDKALEIGKLQKTPYNIQNASDSVFSSLIYFDNSSNRSSFEKIAYQHGNNIQLVQTVLSILLRDFYLENQL